MQAGTITPGRTLAGWRSRLSFGLQGASFLGLLLLLASMRA